MEEKDASREVRENARFQRVTTIIMFAGVGCVALHAVAGKVGPEEFFSRWTEWRSVSTTVHFLACIGLLSAFLSSFVLIGTADESVVPGITTPGKVARIAAFPAVIAAFVTLSNSPHWFAVAAAVATFAVAGALAARHAWIEVRLR